MGETTVRADCVVLPDRVAAKAWVAVRDGRIVELGEGARQGVERVGSVLLPGFVDLQVNGGGGRGADEATPEALATVSRSAWEGGAVAFLPTLITAPFDELLRQLRGLAACLDAWDGDSEGQSAGARPLGIHLEGPFLEQGGAHDASLFVDPDPERIDAVLEAAGGHLRLCTLACARTGAADAVARLRAAGVAVAIGHATSTDGFAECVAAGAGLVTHLFNAMSGMNHREPGIAGLALDHEAVSCPMILDGAHVHPAMARNAYRILGPDRTLLVTDAVSAAGMPDGDYSLGGMPVRLERGVVRDRQGRLAGSALTMARAAGNFVEIVPGVGDWTLARVASTNPARAIGAEHRGRIAVGGVAEFTVRADDGSFRALRL